MRGRTGTGHRAAGPGPESNRDPADGGRGRVHPRGGGGAGDQPVDSVSYGNPGDTFTCPSGNLCAGAWDTSRNQWKIFHLYSCKRYALTNWIDWGWYSDAQTGGVASYFYGQNGNVITTVYPGGGLQSYKWDPVWSIRNC